MRNRNSSIRPASASTIVMFFCARLLRCQTCDPGVGAVLAGEHSTSRHGCHPLAGGISVLFHFTFAIAEPPAGIDAIVASPSRYVPGVVIDPPPAGFFGIQSPG